MTKINKVVVDLVKKLVRLVSNTSNGDEDEQQKEKSKGDT